MARMNAKRRGAVLPLVAICCVAIIGMLALAIDIGMIAIARSQCQNAADSSAMAGARTISGDPDEDYNLTAVPKQAVAAAIANRVLAQVIKGDPDEVTSVDGGTDTYVSGQVKVEAGSYTYTYDDDDSSNEGFSIEIPRLDDTEPYSAVRTTISFDGDYAFARIFGQTAFNTSATATAVHRPRDVVIVMDLSGSMRFQSLPGIPYSGARNTSMNPDTAFPAWGHYSDTTGAGLYGNTKVETGGEIAFYDPANISVETDSGPPIIEYFFKNAVGVAPSSSNRAFARNTTATNTTPVGDKPLKTALNTGNDYARTVKHLNNDSSTTIPKFEVIGYDHYNTPFNGYTEGPGYWGKTFWIWPPCPGGLNVVQSPGTFDADFNWYNNGSRDWRQRFFVAQKTSNNTPAWILHNRILFDTDGYLRTPGDTISISENGTSTTYTYRINYAAILYWLDQAPNPFPDTLQAGRIRYYSSIPDGTDNTLNNRWWTNDPATLDNDERFWKDYIDFVLGFSATWSNNAVSYSSIRTRIGNGNYYLPENHVISRDNHPQPQPSSTNPSAPYMSGATGAHQTTSGSSGGTYYFMTGTTSGSKSSGATSVVLSSSPPHTPAVNNYVTFGSNLSNVYRITNYSSGTRTVTLSPSLQSSVSSGTTVKFYSSNNAAGATKVSVNSLPSNPTTNQDYIGFNNNATNVYLITGSSSKNVGRELTLGSALVSTLDLQNDHAQIYASNGTVGSTRLSVTGLSQNPTSNRDYIIINGDIANPYLVTGSSSNDSWNGRILTISPGLASNVNLSGTTVDVYSPYMDYDDDVMRPKHHFWFGPQTFVDWLGNYNTGKFWWPGNVPEAQNWSCKVGIQTAIDDIKKNHPSDFVAMAFFSHPTGKTAADNWYAGYHNRAIVPLGRNYQQLKDSLWFPPTTVTGGVDEIGPYDADFANVPRAVGGTTPEMGFMLAYNILSNSTTNLRLYSEPTDTYRGNAGGLGRKGASRLIIFETDGAPNRCAAATFKDEGTDSYYAIRLKNPINVYDDVNAEIPVVTTTNSYNDASEAAYAVVQKMCADQSEGGHSTARRPVQIYSLGYGSLFDSTNDGDNQDNAKKFLQTLQYHSGTASTMNADDFPDDQLVYGTSAERIERMRVAFTNIMQKGVQVSLIK